MNKFKNVEERDLWKDVVIALIQCNYKPEKKGAYFSMADGAIDEFRKRDPEEKAVVKSTKDKKESRYGKGAKKFTYEFLDMWDKIFAQALGNWTEEAPPCSLLDVIKSYDAYSKTSQEDKECILEYFDIWKRQAHIYKPNPEETDKWEQICYKRFAEFENENIGFAWSALLNEVIKKSAFYDKTSKENQKDIEETYWRWVKIRNKEMLIPEHEMCDEDREDAPKTRKEILDDLVVTANKMTKEDWFKKFDDMWKKSIVKDFSVMHGTLYMELEYQALTDTNKDNVNTWYKEWVDKMKGSPEEKQKELVLDKKNADAPDGEHEASRKISVELQKAEGWMDGLSTAVSGKEPRRIHRDDLTKGKTYCECLVCNKSWEYKFQPIWEIWYDNEEWIKET